MAMQPMPQQPQLQRPVGVGQGIGGLPAMTRPQPPQPQQPPYMQPPQQPQPQQQAGTLSPTEDLYSLEQQLKSLPYLPGDPQNAQMWQQMLMSKPAAIVAAVLKGKQDQAEAAKAEAAAKAMGNQPPTVIAGIQQKMMNPPSSSPAPQAVAGSPPQQGGLPGTFGPVQTAMASGGQPVQMAGGGLVSFADGDIVRNMNRSNLVGATDLTKKRAYQALIQAAQAAQGGAGITSLPTPAVLGGAASGATPLTAQQAAAFAAAQGGAGSPMPNMWQLSPQQIAAAQGGAGSPMPNMWQLSPQQIAAANKPGPTTMQQFWNTNIKNLPYGKIGKVAKGALKGAVEVGRGAAVPAVATHLAKRGIEEYMDPTDINLIRQRFGMDPYGASGSGGILPALPGSRGEEFEGMAWSNLKDTGRDTLLRIANLIPNLWTESTGQYAEKAPTSVSSETMPPATPPVVPVEYDYNPPKSFNYSYDATDVNNAIDALTKRRDRLEKNDLGTYIEQIQKLMGITGMKMEDAKKVVDAAWSDIPPWEQATDSIRKGLDEQKQSLEEGKQWNRASVLLDIAGRLMQGKETGKGPLSDILYAGGPGLVEAGKTLPKMMAGERAEAAGIAGREAQLVLGQRAEARDRAGKAFELYSEDRKLAEGRRTEGIKLAVQEMGADRREATEISRSVLKAYTDIEQIKAQAATAAESAAARRDANLVNFINGHIQGMARVQAGLQAAETILNALPKPSPEDSPEIKRTRNEAVQSLMSQLQTLKQLEANYRGGIDTFAAGIGLKPRAMPQSNIPDPMRRDTVKP